MAKRRKVMSVSVKQLRLARIEKLVAELAKKRRKMKLKPARLIRVENCHQVAGSQSVRLNYKTTLSAGRGPVSKRRARDAFAHDSDPYRLVPVYNRNFLHSSSEDVDKFEEHDDEDDDHRDNSCKVSVVGDVTRQIVLAAKPHYQFWDVADANSVASSSDGSEEPFYLSFDSSCDLSVVESAAEISTVDIHVSNTTEDDASTCSDETAQSSDIFLSNESGRTTSSSRSRGLVQQKMDGNQSFGNTSSQSWEDISDIANFSTENKVGLDEDKVYSETCRRYIVDKDSIILVLDHPTTLPVVGKMALKVLWGHLSIQGYTVGPRTKEIQVYSPITHNSLTLKTLVLHAEDEVPEDLTKLLDLLSKEPDGYCQRVMEREFRGNTVGIRCKVLKDARCTYLQRYHKLFCYRGIDEIQINCLRLPDVYQFQFHKPSKMRQIIKSDNWRSVLKSIIAEAQCTRISPRIMVTGGKNVGKSSMCRYIINFLLNTSKKVCFLDGDPGQAEFTPPGLLSLVDVSEPCLGPGYTHQKTPWLSLFLGAVSVTDCPDHYKMCIEELWHAYSKNDEFKTQPLIVNTMGFNTGMGLSLLVSMMHVIQPTHVVQIMSSHKSQNAPEFTYDYLNNCQGWGMPYRDIVYPFTHYCLTSDAKVNRSNYTPKHLREVSLLSYLATLQVPSEIRPLNHLPIYKVMWSSVGLHICHRNVPNTHIMYAYNASIVALCKCNPSELTTPEDVSLPKFITKLPACEWLGYGIVRAISMEEKCFYVVTNLPEQTLKDVNALLKGDVEIPKPMLVEQVVDVPIPYLCRRTQPEARLTLGNKRMVGRSFNRTKRFLW